MSYATRAAVIAGFFTFYEQQHPGSCFIGPFGWVRALLGISCPPGSLGSLQAEFTWLSSLLSPPQADLWNSDPELWLCFPCRSLGISIPSPQFIDPECCSHCKSWLQSVQDPAPSHWSRTGFKSKPFIHSSALAEWMNHQHHPGVKNRGVKSTPVLCLFHSTLCQKKKNKTKLCPVTLARCKSQKMTLSVEVPSCLQHSTSSWSATY